MKQDMFFVLHFTTSLSQSTTYKVAMAGRSVKKKIEILWQKTVIV
jgi:hypothetical protein